MKHLVLSTDRLRLEQASAIHATRWLDYETRNREHLEPWEPHREDAYFTLARVESEIEGSIDDAKGGAH